jgi:hypothetical protein
VSRQAADDSAFPLAAVFAERLRMHLTRPKHLVTLHYSDCGAALLFKRSPDLGIEVHVIEEGDGPHWRIEMHCTPEPELLPGYKIGTLRATESAIREAIAAWPEARNIQAVGLQRWEVFALPSLRALRAFPADVAV